MGHDPLQRVLLALILACLVLLVVRDGLGPGGARYEVSVLPGRKPALLRVDTHTGRVEHLQIGSPERAWVALGEGHAPAAAEPAAGDPGGAAQSDPVPEAPAGAETGPAPAAGPQAALEVQALAAALSEENPSGIRAWAAEMMGLLGGPAREDAVPYLTAALEDPDPAVRRAASEALARTE